MFYAIIRQLFERKIMIRHIVFFKFKSSATQEDVTSLTGKLRGLASEIGWIRSIEVAKDIGGKTNSYDLALNTLFDSMEDVERYAIHPEHVKVLDMVKRVCESTVKIDYISEIRDTN